MVSLDDLEAFDLQVWLGSCTLAAEALHCHPSSISRRCRLVAETFQLLTLKRCQYEGRNQDWQNLLLMQRKLHQRYRLLSSSRLRLEAAPGFEASIPSSWWMPRVRQGRRPYRREEIMMLLSQAIIDAAWVDGELLIMRELHEWHPVHQLKKCFNLKVNTSVARP